MIRMMGVSKLPKLLTDELRAERALSFAVRMGINSGEVVVGKIGAV